MAATIGHMEAFKESVEPWTTYIERFEHFVQFNSIDADKKVPVLLSVIGGKTYGLLRSLIAPDKPREKSFKQITDTLQQHFSLKPLIIAERFRFHRRSQEESKSSEARQKRLLTETTLTFQRAVELVVSMETASREAHELSGSLTPGEKSSIMVKPEVEGQPLEMELDTGAAVSLISTETYDRILKHLPLCSTDILLRTYIGQALRPEGVIDDHVKMGKQTAVLPLYVVQGDYPPLYGRECLRQIKLNWKEIKIVKLRTLEAVLQKHATVFSKQSGEMKSIKAKITLKPEHKPKFCQPRVVPFALCPKVEAELNCLTEMGVLSPVTNPILHAEHYPLPRIEDLSALLAEGQCFSKLDLSHAYLQMRVEEESTKFLTISTQKGLFQYTCLLFGIASAPGLPNAHSYLDDILVTGQT
ncbi:hypothetical protein H4Q32_008647 [Labeo rohita]|uniref:Uncharacterized protein n=1 Tax=Labeo rohita TaxID=84645 RepID=A0ABQ8MDH0_LABRO|nr:hypothetical protein H4Q32_008647 [Labeo rohita]